MLKSARPLALAALAAAACAPLPALAEETRVGEVAEQLNDPMTQYAIAGLLSGMATMALDMKIEPLVRTAQTMGDTRLRDLPPGARLRDIAGPQAQAVPEQIVERVPGMVAGMGAMAGALEEMLPQLRAMAERMRGALPPQ